MGEGRWAGGGGGRKTRPEGVGWGGGVVVQLLACDLFGSVRWFIAVINILIVLITLHTSSFSLCLSLSLWRKGGWEGSS